MLCPYCQSIEVIHDFEHGYIVCSCCGSIIDVIFIEHYIAIQSDHNNLRSLGFEMLSIRKGLEKKKRSFSEIRLKKMGRDIVVYEKYVKRARSNVYIDIEAALKREQNMPTKTRIYHHKDEEKVLKTLDNDFIVKMIMEKIIDRDPILSSRTPRGKVALALIIKNIVMGMPLDINDICKKTSLSLIHIRRLLNLVKRRMSHIYPILQEVISNTNILKIHQ